MKCNFCSKQNLLDQQTKGKLAALKSVRSLLSAETLSVHMYMLLGERGNPYFVFTPFCRILFTCCLVVWCFSCLVVMDVVSWAFCWLFCGSTNQHSSSSAPLQGALWLNRLRSSGWISSSQGELLVVFLNCLSDLWPYNGWVVSLLSTFCFLCGRCVSGIEEISNVPTATSLCPQ